MPRPTSAQIAYGSATVVFSTLAMLLLSQTRSGIGVAVVALGALALGLLVAVTVPMPRRSSHTVARGASPAPQHSAVRTESATARMSEHSLPG